MALRRACDWAMTQARTTTRYRALDTYRFLAASGIVFYHFENHLRPLMAQPTYALERLSLFVDFFFVLSGFVIMHTHGARIASWQDYGSFLRKRLARIYPLHLATLAIFCLIGAVVVVLGVPVRDRSFFDPTLIPANLLLVQAWGTTDHAGLNIPSWSISAEWFVYLLFPLLAFLVRKRGPWFTLAVALVVAIAIDLVRARVGLRPGEDATFDFGNLRAVAPFLAGMAVCCLMPQMSSRRVPWVAAHGFAIAVFALMIFGAPAFLIVACFPLLVALVALAERDAPQSLFTSNAGVRLGEASFAIYMIHTLFQVAAVIVARKLGVSSLPALAATVLLTYIAIVSAGIASFRWFEDPLRRRLTQTRSDRSRIRVHPSRAT